ncbi:MAG: 23S rRNA (guanine(2445)-N(2))/(guanine(2069)-N(7))-methyltransferase, partial [Gammaproteobacteria bacterium]
MLAESLALFATTPRGLEAVLADELRELGAQRVQAVRAGVAFSGDLELAYRACLWSRVASRVLLNLARFPVPDADALYAAVHELPWEQHLDPDDTLAVDATLSGGSPIDHSHFAALRVKDAVVDRLRELHGRRPSVDRVRPSLRLNLVLQKQRGVLSIDLSGEALHRRGYRPAGAPAPLKENLAAGLLRLAGWPEIATRGGALVDPLCGTGTLPIEAAQMAARIAPGLGRDYFGFLGWLGHVPEVWTRLCDEARAQTDLERVPSLFASDHDPNVVAQARQAAASAGVGDLIRFAVQPLAKATTLDGTSPGLVVTNPPYGERLGESATAVRVHAELGQVLRGHFRGWQAAVLSGDTGLARRLGAEAATSHPLFNGALRCTLTCWQVAARAPKWARADGVAPTPEVGQLADPGARMFTDRLRKNLRRLRRWARR